MEMKPVAWMSPDGKVSQTEGKLFHIPLYAVSKPLSDEEMMKVIEQVACSYDPYEIEISYDYEVRVARAIEERHGIK